MRILAAIIAFCLGCVAAVAMGQERIELCASTQWLPTQPAPAGFETGEYDSKPFRQIDRSRFKSTKLADIEERLAANHPYRNDQDLSNWAHEGIHGVNSRLRMEVGAGVGCYYIGNGKAWILRLPNIKLSSVARRVPQHLRNDKFAIYLNSEISRQWEDHPLYPLDEWVAYIGGTEVAQELWGNARLDPTGIVLGKGVESAIQLDSFALILLETIREEDPSYPDMEKLKAFVALNHDRTVALQKLHPQGGEPIATAHTTFQQVYYQTRQCPPGQACPTPQWRPAQNPAPLAPVPPKPQQPIKNCNCDNAALIARITKLEADYLALLNKQGPPGPKGDKGDAGPQGTPGKDAFVNIEAIAAAVAANTKPCECKRQDDSDTRPGQPVYFDIKPRTR